MNAWRFHVSVGVLGALLAVLVPWRGTSPVLAAASASSMSSATAGVLDAAMRTRRDALTATLRAAVPAPLQDQQRGGGAPAPSARGKPAATPAGPAADYVGSDTCLACHEDATKHLANTVHWKAA